MREGRKRVRRERGREGGRQRREKEGREGGREGGMESTVNVCRSILTKPGNIKGVQTLL